MEQSSRVPSGPCRRPAAAGGLVLLLAALTACATDRHEAVPRGAVGVELTASAVTFYGSAANCTRPAVIDYVQVRDQTPEWRTIRREGVSPGSARYNLLVAEMDQRIKAAVAKAARQQGCDLVVRQGDIAADHGLPVSDLTAAVLAG